MSTLMDNLVGTTLADRYVLEERVADELLGRVFVARDLQQNVPVHVKILHPHLVDNPEKFARFGREFTATRMVRHPHTVAVVDWGQANQLHYLVFEHLVAHPVGDELVNGPLPPQRAAWVAVQVAGAMAAAHAEGIVHRNLSSTNVLLLDDEKGGKPFTKVRDFGLARLEQDAFSGGLTAAGARVGNVAYMPPEYIEEDVVDARGDVYGLGILLFELLVGELPFQGKARDILTAHIMDEVPLPSTRVPGLPDWCDKMVAYFTEKDHRRRPTAAQAEDMLVEAAGVDKTYPPGKEPPKKKKSAAKKAAPAIGASMLVAAAVLVVGGASLLALALGALLYLQQQRSLDVPPMPPPTDVVEVDAPEPPPEEEVVDEEEEGDAEEEQAEEEEPAPAAPKARKPPRRTPKATKPPPAEEPAGPAGRVSVQANRRVLVKVDGKAAGYTPLNTPLPAGDHTISAGIPGQPDTLQEQKISVADGGSQTIRFEF